VDLITTLPMDNPIFLSLLRKYTLFSTGDLWEQVQTKTTKAEKATWFLDGAIEPSLKNGDFKPLQSLLTAMKDEKYFKSDTLKQLATTILQEIDKEMLLMKLK